MSARAHSMRGGTSTVYRDDIDGTPCIVKVADVSASSIASLDREARVLLRLSSPLAPALMQELRSDGRPALALEAIDGVPLSQWCRDASLTRRLAVGARLCDRIAGIHARGVVHGDLSGRNVLVTRDDDVRVIDFGSAHVVGWAAVEGRRLATPAYLAPIVDTDPVAIADDIYAAGVLLFELCTGRLPFLGTGRALRQAHAMQRPPLPSHCAPVTSAIDRVVLQCLAKDPTRRFADGAALHAAWATAAARAQRPRLARGTRLSPRLASEDGRLVHAALLAFRSGDDAPAAERVIDDCGGIMVHREMDVSVAAWSRGAAPDRAAAAARRQLGAIGCTSFVEATAMLFVDARGALRGVAIEELASRVIAGTTELDERAVYPCVTAPFVGRDGELDALRARVVDALERGQAIAIRIEGEAGTGKSRFLDELLVAVGAASRDAPTIVRITGQVGDAMTSTLAADALSRQAPHGLVVVLDDAQWVDPSAIELLERAARTATGTGPALVIISAARPGGFDALPRWHDQIRIRLSALDEASARRLCRALLPDVFAVPAVVIEHVAAFAGGLPLVLHELVRALRADGAIHDGRVDVDTLDLSAGVPVIEWAVDRELDRLGAPLRGHAFLAAVLEPCIDTDAIAAVLTHLDEHDRGSHAPLDASASIVRLSSCGLLQPRDGKLGFRHALVRDAVLRRVPPTVLREFAGAACDVLGERVGDMVRASWAELAGREAAALVAWQAASATASAHHDHVTVEHACDRALRLARRDDDRRGELLRRRAVARYRLGRHAAAAHDFAAAAEVTHAPFERARLLLDEAMALDWARELAGARRCTEAAVTLVAGSTDAAVPPELRAALALAVGRSHWRADDPHAARQPLEDALAEAVALGDDGYEIEVVAGIVLGWVLAELGELDGAERVLVSAGERARRAGDRLHEAAVLNNRAFVLWKQGAVDELRPIYDRVVAIGRELGMPTHEYRAARWMFEVALAAGDVADANASANRLVVLEEAFPELFPESHGGIALERLEKTRCSS